MAKATKQVNYRIKGAGKAWCHTFKASLEEGLKNVSYKVNAPIINKYGHTHYFRNIDSNLKPQKETATISGHFHEVEWVDTPDGPKVSKCGPPMTYKYVTRAGGVQKRVKVQVGWEDQTGDENQKLLDKHTHSFDYVHSEELLERGIRSVAREVIEPGFQEL